jgi:hypothetical protein
MKAYRLFNLIVAVVLLVVVGLTIREAAATSSLVSQKGNASRPSAACDGLPSRYSIRSEYVQAMDAWVIVTEDGPIGLDGGLIQFLSDKRTCSK